MVLLLLLLLSLLNHLEDIILLLLRWFIFWLPSTLLFLIWCLHLFLYIDDELCFRFFSQIIHFLSISFECICTLFYYILFKLRWILKCIFGYIIKFSLYRTIGELEQVMIFTIGKNKNLFINPMNHCHRKCLVLCC